jgi:hypothetical protein
MWRMQEVLFRMSLKSEPTSTVRDLDQGHVIPNMAPPNWRGIWYPTGFDTDIRDERSSADPDVSAWRPQRTSPAELYGLAMQRSWRRGGDRLLWPAGSAPGSRSASAGVVLRRSELLRVAPFCWSGRIAAGQPKWLGFMACKRSGVRIPVAPHKRPGQVPVADSCSWLPRSPDRHLTVVLGSGGWHWTARTGSR